MKNRRQRKIIVYSITIFIIYIYVASLFIHNIVDRGILNDNEILNPDNNVQGVEDENTGKDNQNEGEIVDNKDRIILMQNGKTNWNELKELDVFNNNYFHDEAIIAPGVSGTYNFTVENISEKPCIYDATYTEENPYEINMVYKLKKNGQYIKGDENNWIKYDKLSMQNIIINGNTKDIYTIEWKWEDAANDTQVGTTPGANYKMFIKVDATEKEGV